jgi:hypothetical protein
VAKRILRGVVKVVATAAGVVFLLDNRLSGTAGIVLPGSVAVLFICLLAWLIFGLGENEDNAFWPKKPQLVTASDPSIFQLMKSRVLPAVL